MEAELAEAMERQPEPLGSQAPSSIRPVLCCGCRGVPSAAPYLHLAASPLLSSTRCRGWREVLVESGPTALEPAGPAVDSAPSGELREQPAPAPSASAQVSGRRSSRLAGAAASQQPSAQRGSLLTGERALGEGSQPQGCLGAAAL